MEKRDLKSYKVKENWKEDRAHGIVFEVNLAFCAPAAFLSNCFNCFLSNCGFEGFSTKIYEESLSEGNSQPKEILRMSLRGFLRRQRQALVRWNWKEPYPLGIGRRSYLGFLVEGQEVLDFSCAPITLKVVKVKI